MASTARLENKVALITGAGSGMGRAEAILFAEEGAKLVVNDVNADGGGKTVNLIREKGGEASFFQADVTIASQVKSMIRFAVETYGKLNILINNAGIILRWKGDEPVVDLEEEIWNRVIDTNLKSAFICSKYAIPEMIKAGRGTIVNTTSIVALRGTRANAYGVSKGGLITLTKSIAISYARENIRCNAICPGQIETPMLHSLIPTEEMTARGLRSIPLKRFGQPREIAYGALYLASDESSFMTGQLLVIDGGQLAYL